MTIFKRKAFNVRTIAEAGLAGQPDENVLATALREKRMLLTHDEDYLDDRRFPPHRNPGVVILAGGSGNVEALSRAVYLLLVVVVPYALIYQSSKIQIAGDGRITIAAQNAETGRMERTTYRLTRGGPPEQWVDATD